MKYFSTDSRPDYSCPLVGNGDIAFNPDCEGSVTTGPVVRAGRRQMYKYNQKAPAPLLPHGTLKFNTDADVINFTQELIEYDGYVSSVCEYDNGNVIKTDCFIHQKYNMYAVRKKAEKQCTIEFSFVPDSILTENADELVLSDRGNTAYYDMKIRAYDKYSTIIAVGCDIPAEMSVAEDKITFSATLEKGTSACFCFCVEDSLYDEDYTERITLALNELQSKGFDAVLCENKKIWNEYHEHGYVRTENELIDSAYRTAMYHMKCYTTRWSIPVGITNNSWGGKFFAFDEYYSYLSLLQSNKLELAKRVPEFRKNGLETAIRRSTDYNQNPETVHARYPWQTGENGEELTRHGFWEEHIFHMAVIALGAFEYFEYTHDLEFLKECYPVIKACAKFYSINSVYKNNDGSYYVGKCTDLERLGSGAENAFFTTCGVIKTFEVLTKAAIILGIDEKYRKECELLATELKKTLPHDGKKYIPCPGSAQKSIAVFTGKYPFDVIDNDDEKLIPALLDFLDNELEFGNMYPLGKKVCTWYAAWKSIAFSRMKNAELAFKCVRQSLESLGAFSEVYEINEDNKISRPWFTTAAGVFASAVNEMLMQSDGENIYIFPAVPLEFTDAEFKLSVKGGAVAEVKISDNSVEKLKLDFLPGVKEKKFNIFFRGERIS